MPLSPHFILPAPCTFMTSHLSRCGPPLPGVRELFPDLFHPRPMVTPQNSPLSTTHDSQKRYTHDMTNLPVASTSRHFQLPASDWSTAQDTAIGTTDHPHLRACFNDLAPYSHVQHIHVPTQRWPNRGVLPGISTSHMFQRSASPEGSSPYSHSRQQVEHGVGPSSLPDNEPTSSPITPSPHMASNSTEFAPQSTSFDQKSVETHSGKKRHKCDICGSYWGRPSSLKIHMVSHTGVKEFVCSICKQDFGVKSNYTRHIRVHHKDSSEGTQTRAAGRRRRGSRRNQEVGPVRFVDEGPKFQGQ